MFGWKSNKSNNKRREGDDIIRNLWSELRENLECKNIYSNVNCIKGEGGTGDGFNLLDATSIYCN